MQRIVTMHMQRCFFISDPCLQWRQRFVYLSCAHTKRSPVPMQNDFSICLRSHQKGRFHTMPMQPSPHLASVRGFTPSSPNHKVGCGPCCRPVRDFFPSHFRTRFTTTKSVFLSLLSGLKSRHLQIPQHLLRPVTVLPKICSHACSWCA